MSDYDYEPVPFPPTSSTEVVCIERAEYNALRAQLATAQQELSERDASFDIRWKADMRAIEQWQAVTGEKLKWPNHSDLCVWLMQQLAALQAATPVGLDMPDGVGWFATEDIVWESRSVLELTVWEIKDDVVTFRYGHAPSRLKDNEMHVKEFLRQHKMKWYRLHMPWDATPVAEGEGVQPDWSQAPEWAEWWAIDKDGTAKWFGTKPEMWGAIGWICDHITAVDRYTKHPWQSSLQRRPLAQQDSQREVGG